MSMLKQHLFKPILILGLCLLGIVLLASQCAPIRPADDEPTATSEGGNGDTTNNRNDGFETPEVVEGTGEVGDDTPGPIYAELWPALIEQGDFETLINDTDAIIAQGTAAEFYAEAQLFRGLAELGKAGGGDVQVAQMHLDIAQENQAHFTKENQALLFTGQTIVEVNLGQIVEFEQHGNQILQQLEVSPNTIELQLQDFQDKPGVIIHEQIKQQYQE